MEYKPTIGLEVHVELNTKSKMFCSCSNDPNEYHANTNICPTCLGHPGTLPVINKEAVRKVIKTGLALNCKIPETSKFDRKNYFYPDLPKGYQISQYDKPFCKEGFLEIGGKKIHITRVHLEEDTGRLIHPVRNKTLQTSVDTPSAGRISNRVHPKGEDYSLVDFNRAGIPLMELVTEPDLRIAKEARKFAQDLQLIFRYLGVSDADMEKGQFRVEVNISLLPLKSQIPNPKSQTNPKFQIPNSKLGTKVEIKNLNSFKAVEKAIDYEIERQTEILKKGKKVVQETRGWNEIKQITVSQRKKEEAHDYRYFPEPDLPTLHFDKKFIQEIRAEIPELPQKRRERFKKEYNLDTEKANILTKNKDLGEYFEKGESETENWVKEKKSIKIGPKERQGIINIVSPFVITDIMGTARVSEVSISDLESRITPENFGELMASVYLNEITRESAKTVLKEMFKTGADPSHIIEEKGLTQVTDTGEIGKIIKEVIFKNPKAIEDYKKGKENALQFLVGQVMAATKGRAKPEIVNQLLKKLL